MTGLGILVYETVFERLDRPSLIMAALALAFLDKFVGFDRRRNGSE